jgi:AcrR family transcriptional regulator
MARPRSLTPAAISDAAIAIVDRDGLAQLSMRSVAAELGVSAMSLYRYVEGRDALEALVVDSIVRGIDVQLSAGTAWRAGIEALVERAWRSMRSHPAAVPLLLTRRHSSLGAVLWGEAMMRVLAEGGFDGGERAVAFRTLLSYLIGAVQVEHFGPLSGRGTEALAALPRDEYPFLSETARSARRIPAEQEFLRGLRAVLDGIERRSKPLRRGRRPGATRAAPAHAAGRRGKPGRT